MGGGMNAVLKYPGAKNRIADWKSLVILKLSMICMMRL